MEGWIKLYRSLISWQWWEDHNVTRLFIYLLLTANHEDNKWRGILIKRGQLITSLANLGKTTGLSVKSVRISLNKLKSTNEVASKGASHYTIITVCNYDNYQENENLKGKQEGKQKGKQGASRGQAKGKPRATNKNDKKEKNVRMKEVKNITLSSLSFVSGSFLPVWEKWVAYKKELGKPYKTLSGMQTKYNELVKLSGDDPEKAMQIVTKSIKEEWSGFFALKINGSISLPGEDPVQRMIRETTAAMKNA